MSALPESPQVTVAVLTYRRPTELARILPLLVKQAATVEPVARVLVVDNDPAGDAAEAVAAFADQGVEYVHEPRPGIAAGRNRAIDQAGDTDALVFIDDDETPSEQWLATLVALWQETGADAVVGAVVRVFADDVDPWVLASGVFARKTRVTGAEVHGAATSNLLLDLHRLRERGLRFDDRFGLTGGSDTLLTHALVAQGGRILWCDEAEVYDPVPTARTTREWVRRRTFRTGNVWSRVGLELAAPGWARLRARLALLVLGLRLVLQGTVEAAAGRVSRRCARHAQGTIRRASGSGVLAGACGHIYTEYRRTS